MLQLFLTLSRTGVQPGEAFALQWTDCDFNAHTIRVERALSAGLIGPTKTGEERTVHLSAELVDALLRLRIDREKTTLRRGWAEMPPWIFCTDTGTTLDESSVRKRMGRAPWMDIPISMGTSLVGCLALGLAVDDTAHVMGHLKPGASLDAVYRTVGPAVLLTTLALGVGFLTLALSEFQTIRFLGVATAATLLVALVADIALLPSLLVLMGYPRTNELSEQSPYDERRAA